MDLRYGIIAFALGLLVSGCANDCYSGVGISQTCSHAGESCELPDERPGICMPDRTSEEDILDCVPRPADE